MKLNKQGDKKKKKRVKILPFATKKTHPHKHYVIDLQIQLSRTRVLSDSSTLALACRTLSTFSSTEVRSSNKAANPSSPPLFKLQR